MSRSTRGFTVSDYVEKTPDGNIGFRDSIENDFWWQTRNYTATTWKPDGFTPALARKVAVELNRLADEIEEEARRPKIDNWPPKVGDVWEATPWINTYQYYCLRPGALSTRNSLTGEFESGGALSFEEFLSRRKDHKLVYRAPKA